MCRRKMGKEEDEDGMMMITESPLRLPSLHIIHVRVNLRMGCLEGFLTPKSTFSNHIQYSLTMSTMSTALSSRA